MPSAIEFDNISKQYRLGLVSTRTISHDLKRWYTTKILRKEDPYLKIGEVNDRAHKGESEYVWALKDITFNVEQGEVLGIIGKNGAGKSTLLKILSKVTSPTTGTIKARGRIASLLEVGTGFHPEMTGRENIYMNGSIMGMTKAEITRKLDEIVDFAGVERYIDTPVKRYSSGMAVRLGFAIAAHLEPEILVVDEILAVGDAEFQKKAIGKMQDVSRGGGRTVLFVSHNMAAIKSLCGRGVLLENGMIVCDNEIGVVIDEYQKGTANKLKSSIIDNIQQVSQEVKVFDIKINSNSGNEIILSYPDRCLELYIQGEAINDCKIALEVLLYDSHDILLAKYAPTHKNGNIKKYKKGYFEIKEKVELPVNITNGDYHISIDLTYPYVEYLVRFPKSVNLIIKDYFGETGLSFDYKDCGFLFLDK